MISRCDSTICGIVLSSVDVEVFIRHELQEIVAGAGSTAGIPASFCQKKFPRQLTWINASTPLRCYRQEPMKDMICDLPARLLAPDERTLVAEWLSSAGDITEAYVSDRRDDDPALYQQNRYRYQTLKLGRRTSSTRHQVGTSGLYSHWAVGQKFGGSLPSRVALKFYSSRPRGRPGWKRCSAYPS